VEYRVLDARQKAVKVITNASYGYAGWIGARWYMKPVAEAATAWGRHTIQTAIKIAEEEGFIVVERDVLRSELYTCEEAFFTGTAAEITPILEVDNIKIGGGSPGKITSILRDTLSKAALGKIEKYRRWITPVY
ncbi:MAG: DNA polymerase domain-containing protein, partial [Candidatus Bathyarchaeia archaeon]